VLGTRSTSIGSTPASAAEDAALRTGTVESTPCMAGAGAAMAPRYCGTILRLRLLVGVALAVGVGTRTGTTVDEIAPPLHPTELASDANRLANALDSAATAASGAPDSASRLGGLDKLVLSERGGVEAEGNEFEFVSNQAEGKREREREGEEEERKEEEEDTSGVDADGVRSTTAVVVVDVACSSAPAVVVWCADAGESCWSRLIAFVCRVMFSCSYTSSRVPRVDC
jgi:hypothetical protein